MLYVCYEIEGKEKKGKYQIERKGKIKKKAKEWEEEKIDHFNFYRKYYKILI